MNLATHCCVGLILFCLSSCGSSRKDSTIQKKIDSTRQFSKSRQDTMPDVPLINPAPAPGTVELRAKVLNVNPTENSEPSSNIKIQVIETLKYGAATPPLAPGDTVNVQISKNDTALKSGVIFTGSLRVHKVMTQFEGEKPGWQLQKFSIKK